MYPSVAQSDREARTRRMSGQTCPHPLDATAAASRATATIRLRGVAVLLAAAGILSLAAWLQPRSRGYGTHEQLGLPSCSSLINTGWPCPTCGLTTSMAAMAHGEFALAWHAQPFGIVLFLAIAAAGVAGLAELLSGRSWFARLQLGRWWLLGAIAGLLGGWGLKLLTGWASGEFPLH